MNVGDKIQIKRKKTYEAPRLGEHAGKTGRITKVAADGTVTLHLAPSRLGGGVRAKDGYALARGRNSQGLRLTAGPDDIEPVKEQ